MHFIYFFKNRLHLFLRHRIVNAGVCATWKVIDKILMSMWIRKKQNYIKIKGYVIFSILANLLLKTNINTLHQINSILLEASRLCLGR